MRRAIVAAAAGCLLAGATALAFFSGGYYTEPRVIAGIVAWGLVLALAASGPAPLPRGTAGRLALGGLAALTAWTACSVAWAPLRGPAVESVQRLLLYTGALLVAFGALRAPRALRAVEPALAAGATVVIGYGLAGRLLPRVLELDRSLSAGGRLEQPITYWNAEGALAAMGLILCARLAGDTSRGRVTRAAAAAAAVPLAAGVYLSFSRGALAAALLGLLVLVAAAPSRAQLRAAASALIAGALAAAVAAALPGVAALEGSASERARDGLLALAALALLAAAAAFAAARAPATPEPVAPPVARRLRRAVAVAVVAVAVGLVIGGLRERPSEAELAAGASATRLTTVSSNRYEYWRVGLRAFADHPLAGLGAGGFRVAWLQERTIPEAVRDAHSLEVEIAAELGLVGLMAFGLLAGGVAAAARGALRSRPEAAAGPAAALLAWFLHASIDWDWQLPAVTLPAVVLAGALLVLAEVSAPERPAGRAAAAPPPRAGPPPDRPGVRPGTAGPTP